jgi:hypothetical protein
MWIPSFPNNTCQTDCLLSNFYFWCLCQNSDDCSYARGLILNLLFYFIDLHDCFCVSMMFILLLWLCSIIWSQVVWYLKHCSSVCSGLFWLFRVFCTSKWILELVFYPKEWHWNFDGNCIKSVSCFPSVSILTILTLLIHEHGRSFHLLESFSISFFNVL